MSTITIAHHHRCSPDGGSGWPGEVKGEGVRERPRAWNSKERNDLLVPLVLTAGYV